MHFQHWPRREYLSCRSCSDYQWTCWQYGRTWENNPKRTTTLSALRWLALYLERYNRNAHTTLPDHSQRAFSSRQSCVEKPPYQLRNSQGLPNPRNHNPYYRSGESDPCDISGGILTIDIGRIRQRVSAIRLSFIPNTRHLENPGKLKFGGKTNRSSVLTSFRSCFVELFLQLGRGRWRRCGFIGWLTREDKIQPGVRGINAVQSAAQWR